MLDSQGTDCFPFRILVQVWIKHGLVAREILGILILQAQFTYIAVQGHEARKGRARGLHERLSVSKVQVFHPMLTFIPCLAQCLGSQWSRE